MTAGPIVLGIAGGKEKNRLVEIFASKLRELDVPFFLSTEPAAAAIEHEPCADFIICIGDVENDLDWYESNDRGYVVLTGTEEKGICFFNGGKRFHETWREKADHILGILLYPDMCPFTEQTADAR